MKKLLGWMALAALAAPTSALAGVGATAHLVSMSDGTATMPTLDYRAKGWLVQVDVLDLVGDLPNKTVNLGFGVSKNVMKKKTDDVGKQIEGVVMPGVAARVWSNTASETTVFNAVAQVRLGAEMKDDFGFGMYVVPMIGAGNVASPTGDLGLTWGGGLQVSAWIK